MILTTFINNVIPLLKHTNIIELYKTFEKNNSFFLILEYCNNGDLSQYLKKKIFLTENETKSIFIQINNAIEYLHINEIIHRDLKPHNILLTTNNTIKICDFGFACFYNNIDSSFCGSPFYMAPEML